MTKHSRNRARTIVAMLATITALWLVGPVAFAQAGDATNAQYDDEVTKVAADFKAGQLAAAYSETGDLSIAANDGPSAQSGLQKKVVGGLPFTGLDVVALLAVAVALTSMGLALRRLTADRHVS